MQGGDRSLRNWLRRQKPPSRGRTIQPPSQASVTGFTGPTLLTKFLKNVIIKMKTRPARSNHWKSTALHSSLFLRNAVLASWKIRKVIWNSTDHYLKNQNKNFCFSILCFKKTNSKWISIYSSFELPNFRLKTQCCGWFQSYDFSLPSKIPIIPTADDVPRSQPKTVLPGGRG